ncbi:hypothetical protein PA25_12520 [Pseudoalteromonas sp. A25]|uniref:trypsin-like serine protease n=1 Tax=Pseudoalteromonas sp. A25 TaxID=116092 RepID=UPI00126126DE|nr:trypsin-like serine protease [Pseudoalteromonas sp. A25]BBN81267.1 hypothetical protein PA25_12520 [Pseudoalteromonas sp. A25]
MSKILSIVLFMISWSSWSIVQRHDVPKDMYIAQSTPEYLIDMPGEGHGVLIKPNWIVTVAHLIFADYTGREITIANEQFTIEKVIVHANAKKPNEALFKGDAKPLMDFMKTTSDIALIKLSKDVTHVKPIELYTNDDEKGKAITAFGRGSTGDGLNGSIFETKRQKTLRRMQNTIDRVDGNWLSIKFDKGDKGLQYEGLDGSGDSGGPLVYSGNEQQYLVGMFSWDFVEGDLKSFKHGLYGGRSYQVRISSYIDWITTQINANP